jgi:hypothetical protein
MLGDDYTDVDAALAALICLAHHSNTTVGDVRVDA